MIKKYFDFPLIFLAYLSVLLYFCIWRFSWLLVGVFALSLGLTLYRKYWKMLPVLLLVAGLTGYAKFDEARQMQQAPAEIHQIAPISDTVEVNGSLLSFRGKSGGRLYQVYYTLKNEQEQAFWKNLDRNVSLSFEGSLEVPEGQRNFNGFDYRQYLATQNIYRVLKIDTMSAITPRGGWFDLHLLRRHAILYCQQHFPAPLSSYMTGLLFGYLGKDFNADMGDIYSSLGIIHLFALSGMQVDFFIDALRRLLLRLGLRRETVDWLQLPFSVVYAFLTGLAVSVLRSLLQKNIRLRGPDNLALTFFALLVLQPKFLLTVGGGLTMLYAFVIVMLSGRFGELKGVKKILLESSVISLGALPLLILDFHVFQPLSILLTFVFSFLFDSLILPLLVVLFFLSLLTGWFPPPVNQLFVWLEDLVKLVDKLFHYPLVLGSPSVFVFLVLLVTIGLLIDFIRRRRLRLVLLAIVVGLFFLSKSPVNPSITMVDIGQGDSFLLQDAWNRKTVLIDTGGKVSFGSREKWQQGASSANADKTLIPYLQSAGIGTLDALILTHTDDDHVGDMLALANKIKIRQIWVSPGALTNPGFVAKLKTAACPVKEVKNGDSLPIFNSQLQILSAGFDGKGDNNDSVITYGNFYGSRFLFTGDLEREGEAKLLEAYPDLKVDVLKAGHHGSKTSSGPDFIAAIQPKVALISVGLNNRYKHPNQETLDTFAADTVKIYRTDQQGAVRFTLQGGVWRISTVK